MTTEPMMIAGIGAVTGYGWGAMSLWEGLLSGKPAAKLVGGFGPTGGDSAWVARISDEGDPRDGSSRFTRALRAAPPASRSPTRRNEAGCPAPGWDYCTRW